MRVKCNGVLKNPELPKDYHAIMISLLKKALSEYENGRYYDMFYGGKQDKQFTFAVRIPKQSKFSRDKIELSDVHISLTISTADVRAGIILTNAFLKMKGYKHPLPMGNTLTIEGLYPVEEPFVTGSQIAVRFLSPLCVREHIEKTDTYYTVEDSDFQEQFRRCVQYQLRNIMPDLPDDCISCIPVEMRKTKVLYYRQYIPVSIGTAVLCGSPELLQYLAQNGIGSRRGGGFGLFQVLSQLDDKEV